MAKAWSAWFQDVLPHVPGVPSPVLEHEIRRAAQLFFQFSRAWQVTLDPVAVDADQAEVSISPAALSQELVRVEKAWYDGKPLDLVTADALDAQYGDDWQTHTGTPSMIVQITPGTVRLYPVPVTAASEGIKCRVSVKPADGSANVPDDMYVKFREAIADGAKSRLMLYPGKPWSNPDMGVALNTLFENKTSSARLDAARSYGRSRIAARPKWC